MKVLSLFSGVGGFDLGLENAGMETVFQCEWDKHCRTILDRHWPTVPKWDDVATLTGEHILAHAPVIDVVAWGSPCQDLSVAGKRAGLEGGRSGLFYEGMRIISELRKETDGKYPRISVWENVYGALNSNKGDDFETILKEMVEAGSVLCEWRVLDAQYFGIPQRRRRVFVVAVFDSATAARCPDPLLPVSEGLRWHPKTRPATRQKPARTVIQSLASGCDIANTIPAELYHKSTVVNQDVNNGHLVIDDYNKVVGTLAASDWKFPQQQQVNEGKIVLTYTKSRRAQSATDDETWVEGKPAPTLNAFDQGDTRATTVIAFENSYRDAARIADGAVNTLSAKMGTGGNNTPMVAFSHTQGLDAQPSESAWPTLRKEGNKHAVAYGITGNAIGRQDHNGPKGPSHTEEGGPMFTLTSTDIHAVAYAFDSLSSNSMKSSNPNSGIRETEVAKTLDTARPDPSCNQGGIAIHEPTMAVRRLTPLECERLMGWPDGWTDGQADTHRYKQCGNGVASPVAQWIGEQLNNL